MSHVVNPVEKFVIRYNFVLIVTVGSLALATIIYLCYNTYIVAVTPNQANVKSSIPTSFDTTTAKRIDNLHTSSERTNPTPPQGRINPFIE